jgi:hypothetical protein
MNLPPGIPILFKPSDTTNDSKFTANDLTQIVARGASVSSPIRRKSYWN